MARPVSTVVDAERCIGCGDCVRVCPSGTLSLVDGVSTVTGSESLSCGHCAAVCPEEAIRVEALDPQAQAFATFTPDQRWLPHGEPDPAQLVRLMASRRSCRNYADRPVERPVLEDLVRAAITAPSATNSQQWSFTLLPTRAAVVALGNEIKRFFLRLNRAAQSRVLRRGLRLVGRPELDDYYRQHYETVSQAIADAAASGRDPLFHGAPALVVIGARPGASMPAADAMLAAQNLLLAAHAMGLGTCLIGYAVEAMRNARSVKRAIGIPDDEKVYMVVTVGYPNETYQRTTGRLPYTLRFFSPEA